MTKAKKAPMFIHLNKKTSQSLGKWASIVPVYSPSKDTTLTAQQAKGGFRPQVVGMVVAAKKINKGAFRYPSNPTHHGISSGYQEAFVTTDTTEMLRQRKAHADAAGISVMPAIGEASWERFSQTRFPERNVSPLMEAGDGARTDTARIILSGPGGSVAGHSGSGVSTTGQSEAHDLLREAAMEALRDPEMTPRAMEVTAAAATLFTMAPGRLAGKAEGAGKLKDKHALSTWEEDRNQSKEHLALVHDALSPGEKTVVRRHFKALTVNVGGTRTLDPERPSSPRRSTGKNPVQPFPVAIMTAPRLVEELPKPRLQVQVRAMSPNTYQSRSA